MTSFIQIRLSDSDMEKIQKISKSFGLNPTTLTRLSLFEKINEISVSKGED